MSTPTHTHHCRFPRAHRLTMLLGVLGWLLANAYYATSILAALSTVLLPPTVRPIVWALSVALWVFGGVPRSTRYLYRALRGPCLKPVLAHASMQSWQHNNMHPCQHARMIERIILSPEAAQARLGVYGTVTLEREAR